MGLQLSEQGEEKQRWYRNLPKGQTMEDSKVQVPTDLGFIVSGV